MFPYCFFFSSPFLCLSLRLTVIDTDSDLACLLHSDSPSHCMEKKKSWSTSHVVCQKKFFLLLFFVCSETYFVSVSQWVDFLDFEAINSQDKCLILVFEPSSAIKRDLSVLFCFPGFGSFFGARIKLSQRKRKKGEEEDRNKQQTKDLFLNTRLPSRNLFCRSPVPSQLHHNEAEGGIEPDAAAPLPPHGVDLHLHHLLALLHPQLVLHIRGGFPGLGGGTSQEGEGYLAAGTSRGTLPSCQRCQEAGDETAPGSGHTG